MKINKSKKSKRLKRAKETRFKIRKSKNFRLVVNKTSKHTYAQIITHDGFKVVTSASTLEKKISNSLKYTGNKEAAFLVGKFIAERALIKNIKKIAFDRSGFKYHGRIECLANSARKYGLIF